MQALRDHVSAGAVVELSAGKQRHSEKNAGNKGGANDRLRRDLSGKGGNPAEGDHEQDTDQRAQEGENKGRNRQGKREGGDTLKTPGMLLHAEHARNIVGGKSGDDTGNQRVVLKQTDVTDLHCDYSSRKRRPEQGGESGAHTGHNHDPACAFVEVKTLAHLIPDTAADLQGGSFTANGRAEEVRRDRGAEDQGRHSARHTLTACDRQKNRVGPLTAVKFLVEEDDQHRADRHQKDDPRMRFPKRGSGVNPAGEDARDSTDQSPAQKSVPEKLDKLRAAGADLENQRFYLIAEIIVVCTHNVPHYYVSKTSCT